MRDCERHQNLPFMCFEMNVCHPVAWDCRRIISAVALVKAKIGKSEMFVKA